MPLSRRNFILRTAGSLAATAVCAQAETSAVQQPAPALAADLSDATRKFFSDGRIAPFPGNTVICHIPHQSRFMEQTIRLRDALLRASFTPKIGLTPPESYHMTVFPGANAIAREHSSWPSDLPLDIPFDECTRRVRQRFDEVRLAVPLPFRVRIDAEATLRFGHPATLRMTGADQAAENALRATRDLLASVYKYHAPDHETYGFHITLAYTLTPLAPKEGEEYREILAAHLPTLQAAAPVLELGLPEFCTFPDMATFYTESLMRAG